MKNKFIIGFALLTLFTTFYSPKKIFKNKFIVEEIIIENNQIIKKEELITDLSFLYKKNIIFLNSFDLKKKISKKSFIKKLEIKKIYPNKLIIKIIEKEPIGILINNNEEKFFLEKNLELIEFKNISKFENLPLIYGDIKNFKILFNNLKKVNFPIMLIKKYHFFEANRWDLIMKDKTLIKLPSKNYRDSLKNFMKIRINKNFEKYNTFDYRLNNQLILK